jgi:hypothetical protein
MLSIFFLALFLHKTPFQLLGKTLFYEPVRRRRSKPKTKIFLSAFPTKIGTGCGKPFFAKQKQTPPCISKNALPTSRQNTFLRSKKQTPPFLFKKRLPVFSAIKKAKTKFIY